MLRMTRKTLKYGKIRYGALVFSVVVHSTVLAVFTGVKMSSRTAEVSSSKPELTLQMIERVVAQSAPKPKPKIEPSALQPMAEPPLVAKPEPAEPVIAQALADVDPKPGPVVEQQPVIDEVEFFGKRDAVRRVCYVVDCSGSMYGQMYLVKDQLRESILKLNSQQAFAVVFFMQGQTIITTGNGQLKRATAQAKSQALKRIDAIRPAGSTEAAPALKEAMQLRDPDGRGPQVVYFLTDGFDLDPQKSRAFAEEVNRLQQTLSPESVLHTIGFWPQAKDRKMLRLLAHNGDGEFIEIN